MSTERPPESPWNDDARFPLPAPLPEEDEGWGYESPGTQVPMHRPEHELPELDSEDGPPPRRGGPTG